MVLQSVCVLIQGICDRDEAKWLVILDYFYACNLLNRVFRNQKGIKDSASDYGP